MLLLVLTMQSQVPYLRKCDAAKPAAAAATCAAAGAGATCSDDGYCFGCTAGDGSVSGRHRLRRRRSYPVQVFACDSVKCGLAEPECDVLGSCSPPLSHCDHGGVCVDRKTCTGCAEGWQGERCGTAANSVGSWFLLLTQAVIFLKLLTAATVLTHWDFVMFVVRGQTAALTEMIGSAIFLLSVASLVAGEDVGYNRADAKLVQVWGIWFGSAVWR